MKIYTVYIKPNTPDLLESAEFIPDTGFSIWAGVFQLFWALYHRMWLCAAVLFAAQAFMGAAENLHWLSEGATLVLRSAFFVLLGVSAYDWRRDSLVRRGYELAGVVAAKNEIEAQYKFFGSCEEARPTQESQVAVEA